jgi:hypothetical protein
MARDRAGMLALLAADATITDRWSDGGDDYASEVFEMLMEWEIASGDQLVDPVCSDSGQPAPSSTRPAEPNVQLTVVCRFGQDSVLTQAAGRDPVPITLTLVISNDGIHQWKREIGLPDFVTCCQDFTNWVNAFHREDLAGIEHGVWTSVEEARASGELRARLAEEWAAFTTPGQSDSSPRVCKSPCSATQPDDSADPTSPATSQPG